MQWFQTRINHRILPTKKYLYNMKYVPSPRCSFWQEEETINHMLWQCQESQNLTGDIKKWLNNNNINLTFVEVLFIFNIGKTYSSAELHIDFELKKVLLPPLGNFADISYLEENFKPHLLRDVCTLCSGALVSDSLLHMLL